MASRYNVDLCDTFISHAEIHSYNSHINSRCLISYYSNVEEGEAE